MGLSGAERNPHRQAVFIDDGVDLVLDEHKRAMAQGIWQSSSYFGRFLRRLGTSLMISTKNFFSSTPSARNHSTS